MSIQAVIRIFPIMSFLIFVSFSGNAQSSEYVGESDYAKKEQNPEFQESIYNEMLQAGTSHETLPYYVLNRQTAKVKGSHYKEDDWKYGIVMTNEGEKFLISAKYHALKDEIHFVTDNQVRKILPEVISAISINSRIYVHHEFKDKKGTPNKGYMEQLAGGKLNLFVRYYSETTKDTGNHLNRNVDVGEINHVIREQLYYSINGETPVPLKKEKKAFLP